MTNSDMRKLKRGKITLEINKLYTKMNFSIQWWVRLFLVCGEKTHRKPLSWSCGKKGITPFALWLHRSLIAMNKKCDYIKKKRVGHVFSEAKPTQNTADELLGVLLLEPSERRVHLRRRKDVGRQVGRSLWKRAQFNKPWEKKLEPPLINRFLWGFGVALQSLPTWNASNSPQSASALHTNSLLRPMLLKGHMEEQHLIVKRHVTWLGRRFQGFNNTS